MGLQWGRKQAQDLREPYGWESRPKACKDPKEWEAAGESLGNLGHTMCELWRYCNTGLPCARPPKTSPTPEALCALLNDFCGCLITYWRDQGWGLLSEAITWMPCLSTIIICNCDGEAQVINWGLAVAGNYASYR